MPWRAEIEPPELSPESVGILTDALTRLNRAYLRAHPGTPRLYESRVRYRREPRGSERWRTIPTVLAAGYGDCEDLACYRAAELQEAGERARAVNTHRAGVGGSMLYHIRVQREDGSIEDPSRRLGMGAGF